MPHWQTTADELREAVEGLVLQYRNGEIGPITFEAELVKHRVTADDARDMKEFWRAENVAARNAGAGKNVA